MDFLRLEIDSIICYNKLKYIRWTNKLVVCRRVTRMQKTGKFIKDTSTSINIETPVWFVFISRLWCGWPTSNSTAKLISNRKSKFTGIIALASAKHDTRNTYMRRPWNWTESPKRCKHGNIHKMLPLTHKDHRSIAYRIKCKLNDWKRLIFSDRNSRNLFLFLLLNLSFAFVELFYGIATNSLGECLTVIAAINLTKN